MLSWAVNGLDTVKSSTLTVDGTAVTTIYGPYAAGSNTYFLSGVFGPLSVGSHNYVISVDGSTGTTATTVGSFNVQPPNVSITNISLTTATTKNTTLTSADRLLVTWTVVARQDNPKMYVEIDNNNSITPVNVSVAAKDGSYTLSAVFGPIAPGQHTITVAVADSSGYLLQQSGTFSVQNAGPVIDRIVVAEATPKNGQLDPTDQLVLTWAVEGRRQRREQIVEDRWRADEHRLRALPGRGRAIYFAGVFGPLALGTHYYAITSAGTTALRQRRREASKWAA